MENVPRNEPTQINGHSFSAKAEAPIECEMSVVLSECSRLAHDLTHCRDLQAAEELAWHENSCRLKTLLQDMQRTRSRSMSELSAKLGTFNEAREVLGDDDLRLHDVAFALLDDVTALLTVDGAGRRAVRGTRLMPRGLSMQREGSFRRSDLSTFLGWSRRSQTPE